MAAPVIGVDRSHRGEALSAIALRDLQGRPVRLSTSGKPLLVNLWASWCGPCVRELPSLDRLALARGGTLRVVAVNAGDSVDVAAAWWKGKQLPHLISYADDTGALGAALQTRVLPMTLLYDAKGKEVWRINSGQEWDGAEAARWIDEAAR